MAKPARLTKSGYLLRLVILFFISILSIYIGILCGPVKVEFAGLWNTIFSSQPDSAAARIILEIRLPRVLYAFAVGGGLSLAGAVFQSILLNPLAEPYILGISSGGTFGAVLSFLLGVSFLGTQLFAFAGTLCVMIVVFLLGKKMGEFDPNTLLLSGVMVGAFFSAAILLMMSLLNENLRTAVFWLIGNLSIADISRLPFVLSVTFVVSFILILLSNQFNLLSLGGEFAKLLGINAELLKKFAYLITSIMIGTLVSVSGIIGFVGLLVPHVCRMLFGVDNRIVFPASFFLGASYLILSDTLARTIIAPAELPVGAITALVGAPVFVLILKRKKY